MVFILGGTVKQQDVIIIGGGMVGGAAALGLTKLGLKVAIIEKSALPLFSAQKPYDVRISAISVSSVKLLQDLGAWEAIEAMRVCPYDGLETWEIEGFQTAFRAADIGLSELGFMVENNVIQQALWQQIQQYPNCQQAVGFEQISATRLDNQWQISLDGIPHFSAPLLLACDGATSVARRWANIGLTSWQYRQACLLATIETSLAQQSVTWQQFFPSGPRAFLPLNGHNGCVVWYDSPQKIAQLQALSSDKLTQEIERVFPQRLGKVKVVSHGSFPLTRQHAQRYFNQGVVLVGDAAHTINPLAGQGVNLGFKDVKMLLNLAEQAVNAGQNIADEALWKRYEQQRKPDNLRMQTAMDLFYKTFKTELLPVKMMRNLTLLVAERATFLKKQVLKYAIGL